LHLAERQINTGIEVTDGTVHIHAKATDGVKETTGGTDRRRLGITVPYDRPWTVFLNGMHQPVSYFGESVIPRDPLPLTLSSITTSLEGISGPIRSVQRLIPTNALHTPHGIVIRYPLFDYGHRSGLFLSDHLAFFYKYPHRTVAWIAVSTVGGPLNVVCCNSVPIPIVCHVRIYVRTQDYPVCIQRVGE